MDWCPLLRRYEKVLSSTSQCAFTVAVKLPTSVVRRPRDLDIEAAGQMISAAQQAGRGVECHAVAGVAATLHDGVPGRDGIRRRIHPPMLGMIALTWNPTGTVPWDSMEV